MKRTVRDILSILQTLPPDMPVTFSPITSAFLGTVEPLRVSDFAYYTPEGQHALPLDERAMMTIYITEDKHEKSALPAKYREEDEAEGRGEDNPCSAGSAGTRRRRGTSWRRLSMKLPELLKAATAQPWAAQKTSVYHHKTGYEAVATTNHALLNEAENQERDEANARLIALAVNNIEPLTQHCERLIKDLKELCDRSEGDGRDTGDWTITINEAEQFLRHLKG